MKRLVAPVFVWLLYTSHLYAANERINQEGRILGPLPAVTNAILFNTNNADAVVSAMQIFPGDQSVERMHLQPAGAGEFGRDDCPNHDEPVVQSPHAGGRSSR